MVRDSADGDWRELLVVEAEDALSTDAITFSADGSAILLATSAGAQTAQLVRVDVATGATEVLAADPVADISGVKIHPDTREPQIVTVQKARSEYVVLDDAVAADVAAIRALHPGDPSFQNADDADRIWLVGFTNDTGPVPYYAYDRQTGTSQFLFEHQPELSRYQLAAMEPFSFTARDGLTVHGYLTFPPGAERSQLPAVLDVHGGPWARDTWGFGPEAQWLANRGYLCIQVNFRGSTGYGKAFINAGDREWGAKMQDDLSDAVAHAIAQGWADPARVAIYRRLLWRLRVAGRRDVHPGSVLLRGRHRRPVESDHAHRDDPAVLGAADRAVPPPGWRSGEGQGLPLVPVAAVGRGPDPDPAADRPGRQRPAGEAGRVRADRGSAGEGRYRS